MKEEPTSATRQLVVTSAWSKVKGMAQRMSDTLQFGRDFRMHQEQPSSG
ncbi:MAG TPA: hypothetical protein VF251_09715 [Pyrinomonadaceae bacterium]